MPRLTCLYCRRSRARWPKGEFREGWVLFEVPAGSKDPVIAYARSSSGSGSLWFKAY